MLSTTEAGTTQGISSLRNARELKAAIRFNAGIENLEWTIGRVCQHENDASIRQLIFRKTDDAPAHASPIGPHQREVHLDTCGTRSDFYNLRFLDRGHAWVKRRQIDETGCDVVAARWDVFKCIVASPVSLNKTHQSGSVSRVGFRNRLD